MSIKVKGAGEIVSAMRELGDQKAMRRAMRGALRGAAKPMLAMAKAGVPVDKGDLKRSLKIATAKRQRGDRDKFGVVLGIDVNEQPATYRVRKTDSGGRKKGSGKGGYYRDPGVAGVGPMIEFGTPQEPPVPFMRRAFDALGEQTIRLFGRLAGPAIEKEAAKIARKKARSK